MSFSALICCVVSREKKQNDEEKIYSRNRKLMKSERNEIRCRVCRELKHKVKREENYEEEVSR